MKATSSRRQIIVAVLLVLALIGAAMRSSAANPSLARDIGTLLLVLWLPVIGNVVAFVIARVHRMRAARRSMSFAPDSAFTAHVLAEIVPVRGNDASALASDECSCTLVVGHEGFTARVAEPLVQSLATAAARTIELELLRPAMGLPRLAVNTQFSVFASGALVATGRVLRTLR